MAIFQSNFYYIYVTHIIGSKILSVFGDTGETLKMRNRANFSISLYLYV